MQRWTLVFLFSHLLASSAAAEVPTPTPEPSTSAPSSPAAELERRRARREQELVRSEKQHEIYKRQRRARARARTSRRCRGRMKLLTLSFCEFSIVPLNITAGGGSVFDGEAGRGAFFAGVEVAHIDWHAFAWTTAEAHIALYETCPTGDDSCSGQGSFFVGTRPGYALTLDGDRKHRVIFGVGLGWGQIGKGFRGRDPEAHGFVVSPSVRYAFHSAFGLQVQAFLPVYSGLGERYPAAVSITIMGVPTLILGGVLRMAR